MVFGVASAFFSGADGLSSSGVTDVTAESEQCLAPAGQAELASEIPSSRSGSGALLGDKRCGNPATHLDPVGRVYVCVCVCVAT